MSAKYSFKNSPDAFLKKLMITPGAVKSTSNSPPTGTTSPISIDSLDKAESLEKKEAFTSLLEDQPPEEPSPEPHSEQQASNKLAKGKQQASNKLATGKQQASNKLAQASNKLAKGKQQASNKLAKGKQQASEQASNKLATEQCKVFNLYAFSGHKRKILVIAYRCVKDQKTLISEPIYTHHLELELDTTKKTISSDFGRLEHHDKVFTVINSYNSPSGGWRIVRFKKEVYRELDRADAAGILDDIYKTNKLATGKQQASEQASNNPGSVPNNNNIKSITIIDSATKKMDSNGRGSETGLPLDWEDLDWREFKDLLGPVSPGDITGLYSCQLDETKAYIGLTASAVQDEIDRVVYDVQQGEYPSNKLEARKYFFSAVRKRQSYRGIADGFKTRDEKTQILLKQTEEAKQNARIAAQDAILKSVEDEWFELNCKDLESLRPLHPNFARCRSRIQLESAIRVEFQRKNRHAVVFGGERDVAKLNIKPQEESQ